MRMEISMRDEATPFLNELIDRNPRYVARALRWTAFYNRKRLMQAMEFNQLGMPTKKALRGRARARVEEATRRMPMIRARHLHNTLLPFRSKNGKAPLWKALRVAAGRKAINKGTGKKSKDSNSYIFGFIGDENVNMASFGKNHIPQKVRQVAKYMEALAEGVFMDRFGRKSNAVHGQMRDYFKSIGLKVKKSQLQFPKRPVVEAFFRRNSGRIVQGFKTRFALVLQREQERARKIAKGKAKVTKYNTTRSRFIRSRLGA